MFCTVMNPDSVYITAMVSCVSGGIVEALQQRNNPGEGGLWWKLCHGLVCIQFAPQVASVSGQLQLASDIDEVLPA